MSLLFAQRIMNRYSVNQLPVVSEHGEDEGGHPVGLLDRECIELACRYFVFHCSLNIFHMVDFYLLIFCWDWDHWTHLSHGKTKIVFRVIAFLMKNAERLLSSEFLCIAVILGSTVASLLCKGPLKKYIKHTVMHYVCKVQWKIALFQELIGFSLSLSMSSRAMATTEFLTLSPTEERPDL